MANEKRQRLLVALDGSERSIRTAKYLAEMPAFHPMEINLFDVVISVPESFYDLRKEPASVSITAGLYAWEKMQQDQIEKHLQKCRKILLSAKVPHEHIRCTIQKRRAGIARDIIAESKNGYRAVVLRRRGMGGIKGLIMGSVAQKLLGGIDSVPIIFAGRKDNHHRILIGVDGSDNAMRAVDFVASTLGGFDYTAGLVTVLRTDGRQKQDLLPDSAMQRYQEEMEAEAGEVLNQARDRLVAAGFDASRTMTKIVKGAPSRAAAIVETADQGGFDTIVVGRRGLSKVEQFFAGRVSTKVLHLGRNYHVWIVN
jgi:nucleotide-binding universal stress UspA family protein